MARAYIQDWGFKDPDVTEPKNFGAASLLASRGNPTVTSATVVAVAHEVAFGDTLLADADDLEITDVVWNASTKRVSYLRSGGTLGIKYLVTCRLDLSDGTSSEKSYYVTIDHT